VENQTNAQIPVGLPVPLLGRTRLPVIKQQNRIGAPRNTVVFALTANAYLKLTALRKGKKARADHALI